MIARQLTRIPYYGSPVESRILEAFAFVYAAGYCNGTISNRMKESYQRAWDFDQWAFIPDIPLGPPGCVIARFEGDYRKKLIVGLRGISNWTQLIPIRSGFGSTAMPDYGGAVYAPFKSGADQLYTALMANPLFSEYYNNQAVPIVVAGHSMGAAIGEILFARFKLEKPGKDFRLIKFASPRVGSRRWAANPFLQSDVQSIYVRPDPVRNFPWQSVPQASIVAGTPIPPWTDFVPDVFVQQYAYDGTPDAYGQVNTPSLARSLTQLTTWPPAGDNPWYVHTPNSYRYALTGLANATDSWWKWRFQYLEHTDEDRWGADWRQQMASWASLMTLGVSAPADVTVRLPESEFKDYRRPRLQEMAEDDFYWSAEGSWAPPPAPAVRPIHHYPRP